MLALGTAPLLLAGCPDPAVTANPLDTPSDGEVVVSVCYAPVVTDLDTEVLPLAVEACTKAKAPSAHPQRWKRTFFLNDCPLFKAMRIAYYCEPDAMGSAPPPVDTTPTDAPPVDTTPTDAPPATQEVPPFADTTPQPATAPPLTGNQDQ